MSIHRSACPACNSSNIHSVLSTKDYTVSKETYAVWHCEDCTLRFTQDIPDQEQIGKYYESEDYVSHSNTSKGLINFLYQSVRNITLKQKQALVSHETSLDRGRILDIGCGTGEFLNTMKSAGWTTLGLEPSPQAAKMANTNYGLDVKSPESLFDLDAGSFDAVTMWHVLEHVHELHDYLAKLKEIIAESGKLIIAVPNYTSNDAKHYNDKWAGYDVPRHLYHFSPTSMRALLAQHRIQVDKIKPMPFDGFYVSMLSEKYKTGSNQLVSAFLNGLKSWWPAINKPEKSSSLIYICSAV